MPKCNEERVLAVGQLIVETGASLREAGEVFGVRRESIKDLINYSLKKIDPELWELVKLVQADNLATKKGWANRKAPA